MLLFAVVNASKALAPTAGVFAPVVKAPKACAPTAVLLAPVELALKLP